MTIKDVTKALKIAGINPPSEVSSKEVIKLFHELKGEIYTVSTAKMVKFLLSLGFSYSKFLDCDRTELNKMLENNLKIDDEPEKSKFRKALDGISDLFAGKGKSGIPFKVIIPDSFESAQNLYNKLFENDCIEIIPQDEVVFNPSSDNKVYYTDSNGISKGVDITQADDIWLQFTGKINSNFYMIVPAENNIVSKELAIYGTFLPDNHGTYYLEAASANIRVDFKSTNYAYYLVFANETLTRFYAIRMDFFSKVLPTDYHWLCIDFGTSNTTVGTWKEDQTHEIVAFDDVTSADKNPNCLMPTIAYILNAPNAESAQLLFGFEAKKRLIDTDYQPKGSIFYNIKQWISADPNYTVSCNDENNHNIDLKVHDIISMFLKYVVEQAEIKLKRHFVNFHFSAPIKLKDRLYAITSNTFNEAGYTVADVQSSLDEGIAIMYERISELREEFRKNPQKNRGDVMIIDCGGGTTDVARCRYAFSSSDVGVKTQIRVRSVNGQYFGGNELTYRIFQLLKIKLSDYYKSGMHSSKIQIMSIDDLISTATDDYLNAVDQYITQIIERKDTPFTYYDQLDKASQEAEWVLPTDYANKAIVNGAAMIAQAKRNFNYLWNWAERIKIEFFSGESRATFSFSTDIQTDKALYFYADPSGEHIVPKMSLKKQDSVPDVAINIKELTALLSPQIYYILSIMLLKADGSELIFDDKEMQKTRMLLSGQSCKISLFRDLMKEYIPGRRTRSGKNVKRTATEMKLSCVKGCIQYLMEKEVLNGETQIITDAPSVIYRVAVKSESLEAEKVLLDGRSIRQTDKVKSMNRIEIVQRSVAAGEILYSVYNNVVSSNDTVSTGAVRIEPSNTNTPYDKLADLIAEIANHSIADLSSYQFEHEGKSESVLSRLETDLQAIESGGNGKLLYFILPNNDGCGFILWQIIKRSVDGKRMYYLFEPTQFDYLKDTVISRFDGKNCVMRA
ncbi:hypothetical protein [Ruminococcus flavefaciens]|uniref:hypothetical protein n=1 Tax=Ruminococcus flavefaciens TaxID=1265 RepID=UPI00048B2D1E|nr:hypothetical protein [Ruminococcus flavefaciens]